MAHIPVLTQELLEVLDLQPHSRSSIAPLEPGSRSRSESANSSEWAAMACDQDLWPRSTTRPQVRATVSSRFYRATS